MKTGYTQRSLKCWFIQHSDMMKWVWLAFCICFSLKGCNVKVKREGWCSCSLIVASTIHQEHQGQCVFTPLDRLLQLKASSVWEWFQGSQVGVILCPLGTSGTVWKHFWPSQLLMRTAPGVPQVESRKAAENPAVLSEPPQNKELLQQNISSARAQKLCFSCDYQQVVIRFL